MALTSPTQVFDALETLPEPRPKLILVGAIDTRDTSKPAPSYYVRLPLPSQLSRPFLTSSLPLYQTEKDLEASKKAHDAIGAYYDAKLGQSLPSLPPSSPSLYLSSLPC